MVLFYQPRPAEIQSRDSMDNERDNEKETDDKRSRSASRNPNFLIPLLLPSVVATTGTNTQRGKVTRGTLAKTVGSLRGVIRITSVILLLLPSVARATQNLLLQSFESIGRV